MWEELELEVKNLLELVGFQSVKRNINIMGKQIDVYAEKATFEGSVKKYIFECKDYGKPIGNQIVHEFAGLLNLLQKGNKADIGIIVAKNGYTDTAEAAIKDLPQSDIYLWKTEDLLKRLIDFDSYLFSLKKMLELDKDLIFYVPLTGTLHNNEIIEDIEQFILDQFINKGKRNFLVLGGFGTGKTVLSKKITLSLLELYFQKNNSSCRPLFMNLSNIDRSTSLQSFMTNYLLNECGIANFSWNNFLLFSKYVDLIFMFDGFDEMSTKVDEDILIRNYGEIKDYLEKGMLTSRDELFKSQEEFDDTFELNNEDDDKGPIIIKINPLDEDQIKIYTEKVMGREKSIELFNLFFDEHFKNSQLLNLAGRPLLLKLLIEIVNQLEDIGTNFNEREVYKYSTKKWIDREVKKGRTIIKREDKINLVISIAWESLLNQKSKISWEKICEIIKLRINPAQQRYIEYNAREILVSNILIRLEDDSYEFSHKSYAEYFIAEDLIQYSNNWKDYLRLNYTNRISIAHFLDEDSLAKLISIEKSEPLLIFAVEKIQDKKRLLELSTLDLPDSVKDRIIQNISDLTDSDLSEIYSEDIPFPLKSKIIELTKDEYKIYNYLLDIKDPNTLKFAIEKITKQELIKNLVLYYSEPHLSLIALTYLKDQNDLKEVIINHPKGKIKTAAITRMNDGDFFVQHFFQNSFKTPLKIELLKRLSILVITDPIVVTDEEKNKIFDLFENEKSILFKIALLRFLISSKSISQENLSKIIEKNIIKEIKMVGLSGLVKEELIVELIKNTKIKYIKRQAILKVKDMQLLENLILEDEDEICNLIAFERLKQLNGMDNLKNKENSMNDIIKRKFDSWLKN